MSRTIAIFGPGLLGGSLLMALRARLPQTRLHVWARRVESLEPIHQQGLADVASTDPGTVAKGADLVVLCTPVGAMPALAQSFLPSLKPETIVTDVGSVKASIHRQMAPLAEGRFRWLGSHPMAGAEKMGVAAARADLFVGAVGVVTPTRKSNPGAVRIVEQLWKSVGARLLTLTPKAHDALVSRSSHLPHVVAAQLANLVLSPGHSKEQGLLCANGFRDTTRIASGSPEMWRDIALANRKNLSQALEAFTDGLLDFKRALENGDAQAVAKFFEQARERRDLWSKRAGSPSPE